MSIQEYLIETQDPSQYFPADPENDPPLYQAAVLVEPGVVDILHTANPTKPGDTLIGAWMYGGEVISLDVALYEKYRPLGNLPEVIVYDEDNNPIDVRPAGQATGELLYHHFAGYGQRVLGNNQATDPNERHYPADNTPFAIEVRHKFFGGNANPAWDSWGWRAEILGGAASRDPSARAIGVYNDADCTDYWYTTGAFSQQASEWQVDEQGDPIQVWATEYNPGLLGVPSATPQDVHHAVLLGSAQEGRATLPAGTEPAQVQHQYWDSDQPSAPAVAMVRTAIPDTWTNAPMNHGQQTQAFQALVDAGIDEAQLSACDPFDGDPTRLEAALRILKCIQDGVITLP